MTGRDSHADDADASDGDVSPPPRPNAASRPRPSAARESRAGKPGVTGRWFGDLGQLDFDVDFFENLLARNPCAIEVLRVLAELVSQKGLIDRAVELDRRLVEALPDDYLARYNLGCSLARAGMPAEAIDALTRAILLGYDDIAHLESDPDLESLRDHPDFQDLLGNARPE